MTSCVLKPGFHHYRVELLEDTQRREQRWYATVWRGGYYAASFGQWVDGVCCTMDTWRPDCDLCGQTAAVAVRKARYMAREWVRWQLALGRARARGEGRTNSSDNTRVPRPDERSVL